MIELGRLGIYLKFSGITVSVCNVPYSMFFFRIKLLHYLFSSVRYFCFWGGSSVNVCISVLYVSFIRFSSIIESACDRRFFSMVSALSLEFRKVVRMMP